MVICRSNKDWICRYPTQRVLLEQAIAELTPKKGQTWHLRTQYIIIYNLIFKKRSLQWRTETKTHKLCRAWSWQGQRLRFHNLSGSSSNIQPYSLFVFLPMRISCLPTCVHDLLSSYHTPSKVWLYLLYTLPLSSFKQQYLSNITCPSLG